MGFFGFGKVHPHNWRDFIYGNSPAFYVIILIVLGLVFFALSRMPARVTTIPFTTRESAWNACVQFVEKEQGVSASDAQDYNPSGVTLLSDNGYQVVVNYAQKNTAYQCGLTRASDETWQLTSLKAK